MIYLGQNNESQMGLTFSDFQIVLFTLANRFADWPHFAQPRYLLWILGNFTLYCTLYITVFN